MYWLQQQTVHLKAVSADNYVYARNGGSVAVLEGGYKGDRIWSEHILFCFAGVKKRIGHKFLTFLHNK